MATDLKPLPSSNKHAAAILGRIINPEEGSLDPDAARGFLKLSFPPADRDRVAQLLARNQDGKLTNEEREELDEYLRADAFLSMLKSKARLSLKRGGFPPE
ncbi:MAG: hypothetical protein BGO49_15610 [Planctomycetales bacterium 71-10]|nr:MAG: hypothetical protein BGO49_15610 [Planctomycetales bacterium 71-10]